MRSHRWRSVQSGLPESAHGSPELLKHALLVEVDGMSRNRAAPTSPPEWVFRHKRRMELDGPSGRITGRLGYSWSTTAYAIGRTAALALRYSIISATTAARTRPQG